jgi:hypothetical protein
MRVNQELERLAVLRDSESIDMLIDGIISKSDDMDDPVYFTDLLSDQKRSLPLQHALYDDTEPKYILEVLRDEWGNVPNPGEYYIRFQEKPLVGKNKKIIPSDKLSIWKRQGVYKERMMRKRKWKIDEKGCIRVTAKDALYFLSKYGINGKTDGMMSYYGRPHSEEPVSVPGNAQHKLHVHYLRFREVEKSDWENMPKREKSKGPKRESDEYYQAHKTKK